SPRPRRARPCAGPPAAPRPGPPPSPAPRARSGRESGSYVLLLCLPIRLAQLALEQLAHGVARQLLDDLQAPGPLVRGQLIRAMRQQFVGGGMAPGLDLAERLDRFAEFGVGHADD